MKLKRIKSEKEIVLNGQVKVDIEWQDTSSRAVRITDAEGNVLDVRGDYGVSVSIKAPPETKKVWRVTARMLGMNVHRDHDDESSARDFAQELSDKEAIQVLVQECDITID
jgi:hypothetical protein